MSFTAQDFVLDLVPTKTSVHELLVVLHSVRDPFEKNRYCKLYTLSQDFGERIEVVCFLGLLAFMEVLGAL